MTDLNVLEVNYYQILEETYIKHGNLIICFDFDNTVYDYHKLGIDFSPMIELLKDCDELGLHLICNTSNGGERLTFIKFYIREVLGIKQKVLINKTTEFDKSKPTEFYTKPYANIYLDDKGGLKEAYERLSKLINKIKNNKL